MRLLTIHKFYCHAILSQACDRADFSMNLEGVWLSG